MFNNDPREPSGSRITESGMMSNLSLVVEQDGAVRLRPEAEINVSKYRREHSEELAKHFGRFGLRRSTADGLPNCQGEEEVQPGREGIELPGERIEYGSSDVFQSHRSLAPYTEGFSTVKSVNQIAMIEGAAGPSWEGGSNNGWLGEEFSDANGVPGDEDSLPSESDEVYQRKMPAAEHSNSLHRISNPIDQPDDLREVGESRGARGLGFNTGAERFPDGENLGAHRHVRTGEGRFICDVCERKCNYASELRRHQLTHTGEKPFKCNVCGKGFTQTGHLNSHRKTHTGEEPFVCDICGKRCLYSGQLEDHRRTHTGEKPFLCDVCGERFTRSGHLNSHRKTHTGEEPFVCDICGKRFLQSGHLEDHRRTHTGEKPFLCDVCGERFTQSGHLKVHLRTHTGETPFSCDFCGERFSHSANMKTHQKKYHGSEKDS